MSEIEDPRFDLVDDPTPPQPDDALRARVVSRGRQRLLRRRAILGAAAMSVAVGLVGSGVAVAQHHDAGPNISVQPTTTTTSGKSSSVTEREASAHGLHFTLELLAPEGSGDEVTLALRVMNLTSDDAELSPCLLAAIAVYEVHAPRPTPPDRPCSSSRFVVSGGASYVYEASAPAPTVLGDYFVVAEPTPRDALPAFLLEPLSFSIPRTDQPPIATLLPRVPGDTTSGTVSGSLGPAPTSAPVDPAAALASSFSGAVGIDTHYDGTFTSDLSSAVVGQEVYVQLWIQNTTDHEVNPSAVPTSLGLVCATDLTYDGHTNEPLRAFDPPENLFYVTNAPLAPGEHGGVGPVIFFPPSVGTYTCEGVVLFSNGQGSETAGGRLTNIKPLSFDVVAAPPVTTATSAPTTTTTSTTVPAG